MIRELRIYSYFSLPTDLAAEMRDWPEFVRGDDYSTELRSLDTNESVTVSLKDEDEDRFVRIYSPAAGSLFDRVTGRTVYALSQHSDNLMIRHVSNVA